MMRRIIGTAIGVVVVAAITGVVIVLVQAVRADDRWASWCHSQGGHVISGVRGGDLCVRNGLIIGNN